MKAGKSRPRGEETGAGRQEQAVQVSLGRTQRKSRGKGARVCRAWGAVFILTGGRGVVACQGSGREIGGG